jgi:hypothetical protein
MPRLAAALLFAFTLAASAFTPEAFGQTILVPQSDGSVVVQQQEPGGRGGGSFEAQQEPGGGEGSGERGGGTSSSESGDCDPNYEGRCLDPDAEDYDCKGGGGNGPRFVSRPFRVVGDDHFGLDRDGDDEACEASFSGSGGDRRGESFGKPKGGPEAGFGGLAPRTESSWTARTFLPVLAGGVLSLLAGVLGLLSLRWRA